ASRLLSNSAMSWGKFCGIGSNCATGAGDASGSGEGARAVAPALDAPLNPSPAVREREGPTPAAWEGEGIGAVPADGPFTPTLSPDGEEGALSGAPSLSWRSSSAGTGRSAT